MKKLVAVLNGESQVEYERGKSLSEHQQRYLTRMDQKMDEGIPQGAGAIFSPNLEQKAQFVANQLIDAIKSGNEQLAAATLSWLATRIPDLQQVAAEEKDGQITISLINDKPYIKAHPINFMKLNS
jgi:hypothetical protein